MTTTGAADSSPKAVGQDEARAASTVSLDQPVAGFGNTKVLRVGGP